ncbi:hypothetical protein AX17_005352 [Amanita inopinata Kibby_2008]|nr:hypothetical protein AX17_005352 [Amanita inopinata Kibby_2008]
MSTLVAHGTFSSGGDGKFTSAFTIEDPLVKKEFRGVFSFEVPQFNVPTAVVTYGSPGDLTGTQGIVAGSIIGPWKLDIRLQNKSTITGELYPPLSMGYNIMGSGAWYAGSPTPPES